MSKCETCRSWFRYFGDAGVCDRIRGEGEADERRPAVIANPAGPETRLRTLPTFGCALHEPREEER